MLGENQSFVWFVVRVDKSSHGEVAVYALQAPSCRGRLEDPERANSVASAPSLAQHHDATRATKAVSPCMFATILYMSKTIV